MIDKLCHADRIRSLDSIDSGRPWSIIKRTTVEGHYMAE